MGGEAGVAAPLPLHSGRQVVAIFVDVDDATAGLTDLALPSTVAPHTGTSYTPPQTRLDVMRAALVAFVGAKLRSVPSTSLLTFGLYAITTEGTTAVTAPDVDDDVTVRELLAPASAGAAGGRAMQAAIRQAAGSAMARRTSLQRGGAAPGSPAVYTAVVRKLELLRQEAEQLPAHPHESPPVSTNSSFANTRSGTGPSLSASVNSERPYTAGGGPAATDAVRVHGILLRSRQASLSATRDHLAAPRNAAVASEAAPTRIAVDGVEAPPPRCWLDIISLTPLAEQAVPPETPKSPVHLGSLLLQGSPLSSSASYPVHPSATNAATPSALRSSEVYLGDGACACAVLDPVELTGIAHRGLALGPALTRLISLQERRTPAFVRRPLVLLDIPAAATPSPAAQKRSSHVKHTGPSDYLGAPVVAAPVATPSAVGGADPLMRLALPQLFSITTATSSAAHASSSVGGGSTPSHAPADPNHNTSRCRSSNVTVPGSLPTMPPALSHTKIDAAINRPSPSQPHAGAPPRKPSVAAAATSQPTSSSPATSSTATSAAGARAGAGAGATLFGSPSDSSARERRGGGGELDRAVTLRYCEATTSTPENAPAIGFSSPPLVLRRAVTAAPQRSGHSPVWAGERHPPQPSTHQPQPMQSQPLDRDRGGGLAVTVTGSPEQLQQMPVAPPGRMSLPLSVRRPLPQQTSPHPPTTLAGSPTTSSGVRSNLAYRRTILGNRVPLTASHSASPHRSSNGSGPGA